MSYHYNHSELDSILQTLAGRTPASQPPAVPLRHSIPGPSPSLLKEPRSTDVDHDDYDPATFMPLKSTPSFKEDRNDATVHRNSKGHPHQTQITDARNVVTWKPALRLATRLISREPAVQERIRKLFRAQHDHERQWWQGREALIKQQTGRLEGRRKLGELLKNVGGNVDTSISGPTPEEDAKELQRYDLKVHDALKKMQEDYFRQFAAMGLPFFNTSSKLVLEDSESNAAEQDAMLDTPENESVTRSQLRGLQERMIGLLEDLCAD